MSTTTRVQFTENGFDYDSEAPTPYAPLGARPTKAARTALTARTDELVPAAEAALGLTDENRTAAFIDGPCSRCGGDGYFQAFQFIEQGRCFRCGGDGIESTSVTKIIKWARRDARAQARAELESDLYTWNAIAAEFATIHADRAEQAAKHARVQARRAAYVPGFVGAVGTKVDVVVTVKFTKVIDSQWGSSLLVSALTEDGHLVKTFGSGATLWDLAENGAKLRWTGTVKEHANWDGQDQTVTTRTKLAAI